MWSEGIRVETVNLQSRPQQGMKHGIRAIPTFIYFENGKEVRRKRGVQSKESLKKMCYGGWW